MKIILLGILTVLFFLCSGSPATGQQPTTPTILEAQLGTDVQSRMIVGVDTVFASGSKVFLWIKIAGAASETIKITWRHENAVRETELVIGGDPWRTWAWKNVTLPGDWTVTVTGPGDAKLHEAHFTVR
jgi:hypothetical protein